MTPRVLVTGGAGFVGSAACGLLSGAGWQVRSLDTASAVQPGIETLDGDVRDAAAVSRALRDIDAVVHCAALVSAAASDAHAAEYEDVNVRGTRVLLDGIARAPSVRAVVLASSMMVYGDHGLGEAAIPEDAPLRPRTAYARTKLAQEELLSSFARERGIGARILRLFNVYGPGRRFLPGGYAGVIDVFLERLSRGEPPVLYARGTDTRDFVHVRDVARAVEAALRYGGSGTWNIGTGRAVSVRALAERLTRLHGGAPVPLLTDEPWPSGIAHSRADARRAAAELGWSAEIALEQGLAETVAAFPAARA